MHFTESAGGNIIRIDSRIVLFVLSVALTPVLSAEQYLRVGSAKAHYIVLNTMFLEPRIAAEYDIVRGNDRAIVNISVISKDGIAVKSRLNGEVRNLLGQIQKLDFKEVAEAEAIYYIAALTYTNRDVLRFDVTVVTDEQPTTRLQFQQRMYLDSD